MMKTILDNLARCFVVTGLVIAGASTSSASTIGPLGLSHFIENASSLQLSFPVAGATGPAWDFSHELSWSGAVDAFSAQTMTPSGPSTASASFFNWNVGTWPGAPQTGIRADYVGSGNALAHLAETLRLFNPTTYYLTPPPDGTGGGPVIPPAPDYTPNPEPMSLILLGTGLLAVARARSRRRTTALA